MSTETETLQCNACGRWIKVIDDEKTPGQRLLAGHVNGNTNRYCSGAGLIVRTPKPKTMSASELARSVDLDTLREALRIAEAK